MNIHQATRAYEQWLGKQATLCRDDLNYKHRQMSLARDPFPFLRATYYRWAALFPTTCPHLTQAPAVPSLGDAHVENFGTWRDADGRPVWGANDLDEADLLPYTNDLVRLATSFRLAAQQTGDQPRPRQLSQAILRGYSDSLHTGGGPILLSEDNTPLSSIAARQTADPAAFWAKLDKQSRRKRPETLPAEAQTLIRQSAPPGVQFSFLRRRAGLGSLGRIRLLGTGTWAGGRILREAKARIPAATLWLQGLSTIPKPRDFAARIATSPSRATDPTFRIGRNWTIRRLAPDAIKVELDQLLNLQDWDSLARAMGWELANIHISCNGKSSATVQKDLSRRPKDWLHEAAKQMAAVTHQDWEDWRSERLL